MLEIKNSNQKTEKNTWIFESPDLLKVSVEWLEKTQDHLIALSSTYLVATFDYQIQFQ